jgi:MscS family membrane protein
MWETLTETWGTLTETTVAGMELWRVGVFFVVILLSMIASKITRMFVDRLAKAAHRRAQEIRSTLFTSFSHASHYLFFAFGLKFAAKFLVVPDAIAGIVDAATSCLVALAIGHAVWQAVAVVDVWIRGRALHTATKMDDMLAPLVRKSLRVTVVVFTLLQLGTILSDKPLTSILAGLGIGGLAVALAAQDTIKHFFGSLLILGDKPFELGDRIVVGDIDGPVEEVGFRSTRIRTLEGNLVSIPNGDLANQSITNIGRRKSIRRVMNIGVPYDTPPEKLARAVEIVKELLEAHEGMDAEMPPRVFFNDFTDSTLNIFAIYWYHPPDWWAFCAMSERLNFDLLKRFNSEGIEFAFPSQSLYLAGDAERPILVAQAQAAPGEREQAK